MRHAIPSRGIFPLWVWALVATLALLSGCEESPRDKFMDGRQALTARDADGAEEKLQAAIEADPDLLEARRLMANVHLLRGDFEQAEATLDRLWDEQGFAHEAELDADARRTRQLMNKQYTELYRQWAASIDPMENPESFETVGQTGLERNSRDFRLAAMMVEFYQDRADRLIEANERIEAAEMLENIDDLRTFTDTRRAANRRATELRRQAFSDEAVERFDDEIRGDLIESGAYDPETHQITMSIDQPLDRRLDPDDQEALTRAQDMAIQTLLPTISQLVTSIGGFEVDELEVDQIDTEEFRDRVRDRIVNEDFEAGQYEMVVAVERRELIDLAFEYKEHRRKTNGEVSDRDSAGRTTEDTP